MAVKKQNPVIQAVFFGNYFYALCALALTVEATLQQESGFNSGLYYVMMALAVVVYYTHAYISIGELQHPNSRSMWYSENHRIIRSTQILFTIVLVAGWSYYFFLYRDGFRNLSLPVWCGFSLFPVLAVLYYGVGNKLFHRYSLRSIGWLKPFVIGMIWAGMVTFYPLVFHSIETGSPYHITFLGVLLFIKNMMFVTILCIMFDIKDYVDDYNQKLKTFVTRFGLRSTIFYIITPLSIAGLAAFIAYGTYRGFSGMKMFLNVLPFVALLVVAQSLLKRKTIFYYLIIIDGLMLFKAICGSVAMKWF